MSIEHQNKSFSREDLYKQFNKPSPLDTIAAILIYSGSKEIPADTKSLHDFVREKRKEEKFKKFLGDFAFSQTDIFPFSRSLDEGMTMFELGGLLAPQHGVIAIDRRGRERAERRIHRVFKEDEIMILRDLGKQYGDVIKKEGVDSK